MPCAGNDGILRHFAFERLQHSVSRLVRRDMRPVIDCGCDDRDRCREHWRLHPQSSLDVGASVRPLPTNIFIVKFFLNKKIMHIHKMSINQTISILLYNEKYSA
jgi:hypothetical protein